MCRALVWNAVIALLMGLGVNAAWAENRVALVIGQSAYRAVPALPNPANDAKAIATMLGEAGFEVTSANDLAQNELRQQVGDFAAKIAAKGPDTVAVMFYAGHGIQVDGENYLIPVDIDPKREADIPLQAVRLDDVLNTLTSVPSKTRIIMLDACRNNPFPDIRMTTGHGLALVDTKAGSPGTLLSYSTSPGAEAEDGTGADSPYTTALLKSGRESGLEIEDTFKRVRLAVNQATEGRQTPWESSSLISDFRFFGAADGAPKPAPAKRTVEEWRTLLTGKPVAEADELIVADGSVEAYEAFVALFADPPFGPAAKLWLDRQRRMLAWNRAVLVNTGAAYRGFLEIYPDSDLTATARKLEERTHNRIDSALALSVAPPAAAPVAAAPAAPGSVPAPSTAALTCPCGAPPVPPVLEKKTDTRKLPKRADRDTPPKRRGKPQVYDDDEEVVVVRRPPPVVVAPRPVYGFGGGYRGPVGPVIRNPGRIERY